MLSSGAGALFEIITFLENLRILLSVRVETIYHSKEYRCLHPPAASRN
jgi:hypothetical protein